eukprot:CAMPEP_0185252590 /NCGR_PEP_ID=MMETSP1359-20130426/1634_1 /TAXON_ID=552665 /ORGANISM="Bigelowiella longifila, Strain CCMP242" /LENGTH=92 /DNA_ID=CAMNT_0027834799 /DNA_START=181 /DNA_END=462 /DNA_ORIENTATION=+
MSAKQEPQKSITDTPKKQSPKVQTEDVLNLAEMVDTKDSSTPTQQTTLEKQSAAELASVWGSSDNSAPAKEAESKKENESLLDMFLVPEAKQ